ncbi:MAG: MoaD family protein [Crenarchaeota archaeon]|nr:MoaD family protein [Thermoproteota archaeon]MCR8470459.1 MoaD family protein [Thermoproteota archaeon]MCR8471476.1 MoaD family protein [Thermoproteota archaeon]MCR8487080.1 MoaD family protein [Thermoproteota archaeon]MCR8488075.1 MoaD family protein [Thermoproteota archaeon]
MQVKVRYLGKVRSVTEKLEETVNVNGKTIKELLERLCEIYGDKFKKMILPDNKLAEDIIILVNGKSIGENLDFELNDGDICSLLPFVSGG